MENQKINLTSGIFVDITITIDEKSWITDGIAFGACLHDLQQEGWWLKELVRFSEGGGQANLERRWMVAGLRSDVCSKVMGTEIYPGGKDESGLAKSGSDMS